MTQVAQNIIKVKGWPKNWLFNGLSIRQSYNEHHTFEVSVLVEQASNSKKATIKPDDLTAILGETIDCSISAPDKGNTGCSFQGFVDQVLPVWTSRACMLRIIGYSPTMLMDCGPKFRTFNKKPLSEIVQKVMANYRSKIAMPSFSGADSNTEFTVQTQETDYRYLCRLADDYGKLFYYDGLKLHFGNWDNQMNESGTGQEFEFGTDIKQASLALNLVPLNFSVAAYQLESGKILPPPWIQKNIHADKTVNQLIEKSAIYPVSNIHLFNPAANTKELETKSQLLLSKQAHDLLQLSGISDVPGLKIGSKIKITNTPELLQQGEYIIVSITHSVSNDYAYSNSFTAIPAGFPFPPRMTDGRPPICGPLMAIVKDHNDPQRLGRVRVQFIGDEEQTLSPWLRVLTPFTGNGGMAFRPEEGDEVVVEAEDFKIEKYAYVSGAFYQSKSPGDVWHDAENKKKGFQTKKVLFQIDDRTGKLRIEAEEIEIYARKKIKTEAEESEFTSDKTMRIKGGQHLTQEAGRIDLNP